MNPTNPLDQLRDIHLPEAVSWWPPAPGWWLGSALLLLGIAVLSWQLYRRWRDGAYRRAAISELKICYSQFQQNGNGGQYLQQLNLILKRTALISFPQRSVASLNGKAWCEFLERAGGGRHPGVFSASGLATSLYSAAEQIDNPRILQQVALDWLHHHRAQHD